MISEEIYADLIDHVCQANGTKHLLAKPKFISKFIKNKVLKI